MNTQSVSILNGSTFAVSDRRGDIEGTPGEDHGLFRSDTRFLSRWVLTVNGKRPTVLSTDDVNYFRAQFFMALATGTVYVDSKLSVVRRREIADGFVEEIAVVNHGKEDREIELELSADSDFADLFEVKDKLRKKGSFYKRVEKDALVLGYKRDSFVRETRISSSTRAEIHEEGLRWKLRLAPHSAFTTRIEVLAVQAVDAPKQARSKSRAAARDKTRDTGTLDADLAAWIAKAPRVRSSWDCLPLSYHRSLVDLAALRFRSMLVPGHALPAAGLPWFMAMFGRDSVIASFQALPFIPELAKTSLCVLAALQARTVDPFRDAEPGKILHELRLGELTAFEERPHSPYFGSADATPLFLILLDEYERWTGDTELVKKLEPEARAAIAWMDDYGDRDRDGYIEYERRIAETGLDNQCWKDSPEAIAFADGRIAKTPRATCEIQGYFYDAKVRTARLARTVWNDERWAESLTYRAEQLKQDFNRDFWMPERRCFALALDGDKQRVDSITSNIGHLLWSGIADEDKAAECVKHLMGPELFSGWGIRTMARGEGSYNPIGYHLGTVWPHDSSIIAWGLRRYGYRKEAARLSMAILEAAPYFRYRLPEAFAGYDRGLSQFPVEYPTACSPQAWASGAPLLLLRALLGLDVADDHLIVDPAVPEPIDRIEVLDIPYRGMRADAFGRARVML